jgi:micrococcal nuclease
MNAMSVARIAFAAALLLAACGQPALAATRVIEGTITRVSDGDTVWLQPDDRARAPVKLRLQGIDAPERCQAWGEQSRDALAGRVLQRRVAVTTRASDDYGRMLGIVALDGVDINAWMVAQGHAWSARWHRSAGIYGVQEQSARASGKGLFTQPDAIEPRRFRRLQGPCE